MPGRASQRLEGVVVQLQLRGNAQDSAPHALRGSQADPGPTVFAGCGRRLKARGSVQLAKHEEIIEFFRQVLVIVVSDAPYGQHVSVMGCCYVCHGAGFHVHRESVRHLAEAHLRIRPQYHLVGGKNLAEMDVGTDINVDNSSGAASWMFRAPADLMTVIFPQIEDLRADDDVAVATSGCSPPPNPALMTRSGR